jgi:hypothetical protein
LSAAVVFMAVGVGGKCMLEKSSNALRDYSDDIRDDLAFRLRSDVSAAARGRYGAWGIF